MTDTPRLDALQVDHFNRQTTIQEKSLALLQLCRQLERELAEARDKIKRLESSVIEQVKTVMERDKQLVSDMREDYHAEYANGENRAKEIMVLKEQLAEKDKVIDGLKCCGNCNKTDEDGDCTLRISVDEDTGWDGVKCNKWESK